MTLAPDLLDELDLSALELELEEPITALPAVAVPSYRIESIEGDIIRVVPGDILQSMREVNEREIELRHEERMRDMYEHPYRDYQGRNHYCYCSPGRSQFFAAREEQRQIQRGIAESHRRVMAEYNALMAAVTPVPAPVQVEASSSPRGLAGIVTSLVRALLS